jgi:hypothetical protein
MVGEGYPRRVAVHRKLSAPRRERLPTCWSLSVKHCNNAV